MKQSIFKAYGLLSLLLLLMTTWSCQDEPVEQKQNISPKLNVPPQNVVTQTAGRLGSHSFWYFFRGATTDYIYYAYSDDGATWQGNSRINSTTTPCSPTGVFFNNRFIVASRGKTNPYIYLDYSSDGISWYPGMRLNTAITTLSTPGFAVINNTLYLFYPYECVSCAAKGELRYVYSTDGTNWSGIYKVQSPTGISPKTSAPITVTVDPSTQKIHIFYSQADRSLGSIQTSYSTGSVLNFDYPEGINDCVGYAFVQSDVAPAAAYLNGSLFLVARGDYSTDLYVLKYTPGACPEWSYNKLGAKGTQYTPSMASQGGKLVLVFSDGNQAIWRGSSLDGAVWVFDYAIGKTTHGNPTIIGG